MASPSISSSSTGTPFQDVVQNFNYRRLLLHGPQNPVTTASVAATPPSPGPYTGENSLDTHVVMVLSVLLCALICALGLNSIIRYVFRCLNSGLPTPGQNPSAQLANTGIKKKALKTFPVVSYSAGLNLPRLDSECVICLTEFTNGERLKVLPKCNHGFHVRCIDKWLNLHSTCPTCRHCLIETCQKIAGCNQSTSTITPPPLETVVAIVPLRPEGLMTNYRKAKLCNSIGNCLNLIEEEQTFIILLIGVLSAIGCKARPANNPSSTKGSPHVHLRKKNSIGFGDFLKIIGGTVVWDPMLICNLQNWKVNT